jgi:TonB family protein
MALLLRASKVADGKAEIILDAGQIIIGRLPSNNLVLAGAGVEPIHAMVEINEAGEGTLMDMGSDSGVRLNGRTIEVLETIKPGDHFEIGNVRIDVLDPADLAKAVEDKKKIDEKPLPPPPPPPAPRAGVQPLPAQQPVAPKEVVVAKEPVVAPEAPRYTATQEIKPNDLRKTVVAAAPKQPSPVVAPKAEAKDIRKPEIGGTAHMDGGQIFQPGKERPSGAVVEVVAFWDSSILDVRHYGGESAPGDAPRSNNIRIGNEEDGHIIGVGPGADTRNYLLGTVSGSRTTVFLDKDMKGRFRRGGRFEKVAGPKEVSLDNNETALVRHGPITYFLMNVAIPRPSLKRYEDLDGKPIIFWWASAIYAILVTLLIISGPPKQPNFSADSEVWDTVLVARTPTPAPTAPPPKPPVVVPTQAPTPKATPKHEEPKQTPKPTVPTKKPDPVRTPAPQKANDGAPKINKAEKDNAAGRSNAKAAPGNSGGAKGGTQGASAGQREGTDKHDAMGVAGGKKSVTSGINFGQLGAGLGKITDKDAIGAIATGLKSSSGGEGAGAGSGKRGSHGLGGVGNSSSLSTGGPANALAGLSGGAGGVGAGGLGGPGGNGFGTKMKGSSVVVPEQDAVTEGSLTKEEIEAVIRANLAQIKACYERNLQGNRQLSGRVQSAFVINADGRVTTSSVSQSTLASPATESCIAEAIKRWKFPQPRGGGVVNVKYPFVLQPR